MSFRIAPGIRIRASSRGIRTSIGPRAARLHVGGGRSGVSSSIGPLGFYTGFGGHHGHRGHSRAGGVSRQLVDARALEQLRRAAAQDELLEIARQADAALAATLTIHHQDFPEARRLVAPALPPVDVPGIRRYHQQRELEGIGLFDRELRASATARAEQRTRETVAVQQQQRAREQQLLQAEFDDWWHRLVAAEPEATLSTLTTAFEDNTAPAACVGVEDGTAFLLVLVPGEDAIPHRRPETTAAGNLSLRQLTQTEIATYYRHLVCGTVLVTVKEAFARVPGLRRARIVAVRAGGRNAYGRRIPEAIMVTEAEREALHGVWWRETSAVQICNECLATPLLNVRARTGMFQPLDLSGEPGLQALLDVIDLE